MKRPMTQRGYDALRAEITRLKGLRPELAKAIEVARAQGDLSENADYDAAKERSGMVEAKIRDIDSRLTLAEIHDPNKLRAAKRVMVGVSVRVSDVDSGEDRSFTILGTEEADAQRGWISYESPLGKGLIGKEVGDVARLQLPSGVREYEITEIYVDDAVFSLEPLSAGTADRSLSEKS